MLPRDSDFLCGYPELENTSYRTHFKSININIFPAVTSILSLVGDKQTQ